MPDINMMGGGMPQRPDNHEAAMARADLYKAANYSFKLFKMIQDGQELEGWVQAKITKAADYIASVYHYMEYEMKFNEYGKKLQDSDMYTEDVKRQFVQKLTEARVKMEKLRQKNINDVKEGRADDIADRLAAKKAERDDPFSPNYKEKKDDKKPTTRKVAGKAYGGSKQKDDPVDESSKPDFLDMDKDGNRKEPMKKAVADKKKGAIKKEGIEDKIAAAREKAAAKGKIKEKEPEKKSNVRKVAGKAYGGSKQKDDQVDESCMKKFAKGVKEQAAQKDPSQMSPQELSAYIAKKYGASGAAPAPAAPAQAPAAPPAGASGQPKQGGGLLGRAMGALGGRKNALDTAIDGATNEQLSQAPGSGWKGTPPPANMSSQVKTPPLPPGVTPQMYYEVMRRANAGDPQAKIDLAALNRGIRPAPGAAAQPNRFGNTQASTTGQIGGA